MIFTKFSESKKETVKKFLSIKRETDDGQGLPRTRMIFTKFSESKKETVKKFLSIKKKNYQCEMITTQQLRVVDQNEMVKIKT